ncbi:MAG TPA: sigma-70 family RNA polymerase sigma factor [Bacteroidota bacterium]|nr:sigma-70 family RNA polymerase sigma factor [Bacteroidota bacterium]
MEESREIQQVLEGDQSAFRAIVERYQDRVYGTCLNMLQDREDAEDIAQEVFLEVYNSLRSFRREAKLSTWIYRIAVTKSLDLIRRRKRKKRFAHVQSLFAPHAEEPAGEAQEAHPDVRLEEEERGRILMRHIDRLPESQRAALLMFTSDGLSYQEISDVLRTTVPAVESLIFRARRTLRKRLYDFYRKHC